MLHIITTWLQSRIVREDEGATMVEYGLMVALIAIVSIGIVTTVGQDLLREVHDRRSRALSAAG